MTWICLRGGDRRYDIGIKSLRVEEFQEEENEILGGGWLPDSRIRDLYRNAARQQARLRE